MILEQPGAPRFRLRIVPLMVVALLGFALPYLAIAHAKPDPGCPLTTSNVAGWLFFEGVYVGPTEEVPFRALLVSYRAATMPGRLHVGRLETGRA